MATTIETKVSGTITWEYRTTTGQRRYNGKCRTCKQMHSILVDSVTKQTYRSDMIKCVSSSSVQTYQGRRLAHDTITCCGKAVDMKPVKGVRNPEIACGAKCLSSKGHTCECSCGGRNHGAGWA